MQEQVLQAISIILLTMLKFIAGPTLGYAAGFNYLVTVIITITGMMSSVLLFTFLGKILRENLIKRFYKNRKIFTKRSRKFVDIWQKYGEIGVAVLTPVLFTPIGGTIMLTATGTKKRKLISYMLFSGIFWSFIITAAVYLLADTLLKDYF